MAHTIRRKDIEAQSEVKEKQERAKNLFIALRKNAHFIDEYNNEFANAEQTLKKWENQLKNIDTLQIHPASKVEHKAMIEGKIAEAEATLKALEIRLPHILERKETSKEIKKEIQDIEKDLFTNYEMGPSEPIHALSSRDLDEVDRLLRSNVIKKRKTGT